MLGIYLRLPIYRIASSPAKVILGLRPGVGTAEIGSVGRPKQKHPLTSTRTRESSQGGRKPPFISLASAYLTLLTTPHSAAVCTACVRRPLSGTGGDLVIVVWCGPARRGAALRGANPYQWNHPLPTRPNDKKNRQDSPQRRPNGRFGDDAPSRQTEGEAIAAAPYQLLKAKSTVACLVLTKVR